MKIGGKLLIGFLCMAALTIGLLWIIQGGILKDSYVNQRVQTVRSALRQASSAESLDFSAMENDMNAYFLLLDPNGKIEYSSHNMPMPGMIARQCQMMTPDTTGSFQRISAMNGGGQYALVGYPLPSGGTLFAVFSLTDLQNAANLLMRQLWIVTAALVGFSVFLAIFLSRKFSRPIQEVTLAARDLASGRLDVRLPVRSKDEIGQLTRALNDLSKQLKITDNLRKELIANVSHELRSPLSVIQGYAETVRDVTWPDAEKRTGQLTIIAEESERLSRIVADILDYSRMQAGEEKMSPSVFEAAPIILKIIKLNEQKASAKNVSIHFDSKDFTVLFDKNRFSQVVMNLLLNAVSYAREGSQIMIDIKKKDGSIKVSIQNEGDDIPKEELNRIWDRYYRGSGATEPGTGFGLSIVKEIMELHHCTYGVQSQNGHTVFWFMTQKS